MVELAGFEPTASVTPRRRATRLRYSSMNGRGGGNRNLVLSGMGRCNILCSPRCQHPSPTYPCGPAHSCFHPCGDRPVLLRQATTRRAAWGEC